MEEIYSKNSGVDYIRPLFLKALGHLSVLLHALACVVAAATLLSMAVVSLGRVERVCLWLSCFGGPRPSGLSLR